MIEYLKDKIIKRGIPLRPCLGEAEIRAFETKHAIRLPEDYREFVLNVGNGSDTGPQYGFLALGLLPDRPRGAFENGYINLSKPFPFSTPWVWEDEEWNDAVQMRVNQTNWGNLILGTEGCGIYWVLVVTGESRGQVWLVTDVGITPCEPRLDFVSWYDQLLEGDIKWWSKFVSDWGPFEGAFFAYHAPKQLTIKSPNKPLGTSQPMCKDCIRFFRQLAIQENKSQVIADPYFVRIFYPDGKIELRDNS